MAATPAELSQKANAFKAAGRLNDAIETYREWVRIAPQSGAAEHNLAATLGDLGRWKEAEGHLAAAFRKGLDAPETWLVKGRCLTALRRLDEAETAFREALKRRPALYEAQRDLAQLTWMRTGDVGAALTDIEAAMRANPADGRLAAEKAKVLEFAGRLEDAFGVLRDALGRTPHDAFLLISAAQVGAKLGSPDALALAERGAGMAPGHVVAETTLVEALLAQGNAPRAAMIAEGLRAQAPNDQHAIALLATAWRLMGDAKYRELYDYSLVSRSMLDAPVGWASLPAYVSDLAAALKDVHAFRAHPFDQSLRHGSQAADLLEQEHPAIRALPQALDGPIKRRLKELGSGSDPVRSRNTGGYAFRGMWSVRLYPNGYHVDHVHPQGWLSSACYVETVKDNGREGWIKFGEPGVRTEPKLGPEHFEKPEPGLLVLFPSYMWHGTVPFTGDQTRLTFAFDLVPA
jgi:tetratricopeptide (TPR) repeat protein